MEKSYDELRREMAEKNENLIGTVLRPEEKLLDEKLRRMKEDFVRACGGIVPYDMPVLRDRRIWDSELYRFCKALPKGADLHVHGTALLPVRKLIEFLLTREDILIDTETLILHRRAEENEGSPDGKEDGKNPYRLRLSLREAFRRGLVSRGELLTKWTVLGGENLPDIWPYFEGLFDYTAALDEDMDILREYYIYAFRDYLASNILHIEIHILLSEDREETLTVLRTVRDAYYTVKAENPDFVVSVIGAAMKMKDYSLFTTESTFRNAEEGQRLVRDEFGGEDENFVLGFDLINEEDTSRPLREFAPSLMEFKKTHPEFQYFLHCGESLDPRNDNLIDAYLIGATRVGHGTNLYRYPYLLKCYAEKEICLESCLISNQTLRYTRDIRLHPSAEYLKRGVSVALCSDDPVFQENEELTDDFFAAIMSWNLGIAEIKQLAINSITFSGLEPGRKTKLLRAYRKQWEKFVRDNNR